MSAAADILIRGFFLCLYIFIALRFGMGSVRALKEHYSRERQPYETIPGSIVDFELRWRKRPGHSGKQAIFDPVFEYRWKGKTYRKFHRRVMAGMGPGLTPVPLSRLQVGDAVQVRVFGGKPGEARLEEPFYFWKSRIWGHMLTIAAAGIMAGFGVYSILRMLMEYL